jgi:hypothetical protein
MEDVTTTYVNPLTTYPCAECGAIVLSSAKSKHEGEHDALVEVLERLMQICRDLSTHIQALDSRVGDSH